MTSDPKRSRPDDDPPAMEDTLPPEALSPDTEAGGARPASAETIGSVSDIFSGVGFGDDAPAEPGRAAPAEVGRIGEYELLQKIGEGGMGVVYLARQANADRTVALKVIRPDRLGLASAADAESVIERFRTEAKASAKLEHDNIVTIYEVGESAGRHFFSMRLVSGSSLGELLRDRPLENRRAAQYVRGIALGMAHAHQCGILHRDLKPQNVLVDAATDRPLITDFGLAKFTQTDSELTRHGEIVGTPAYMSPEQARDSAHVTQSADIYAIGATMYHLLTGRPPFAAASPLDTLNQVLTEEPASPRRLNPAIDKDLETICLKCLEKTPASRYESAQEVADELDRYLAGVPIQARPLGPATRLVRWCRRSPLLASLATTILVLLMAFVGALIYTNWATARSQKRSEASFRSALNTVNRFFTRVSEEILLDQPGMQPYRRGLLNEALEFYQEFLRQRSDDPQLREEVARTYFRIGVITEQLDSPEAALPYYQRALEEQQALGDGPVASEQKQRWLSDTWNAMGRSYHKQHLLDKALEAYETSHRLRAALAAETNSRQDRRKLANSLMNIGLVEGDLGQPQQAVDQFAQAQQRREELLVEADDFLIRRDLGMGYYNWFQVLDKAKQSAQEAGSLTPESEENLNTESREKLTRAVDLFQALVDEQPGDFRIRYLLGVCYRRQGDVIGDATAFERARLTLEPLVRQNPALGEYQRELALVYLLGAEADLQRPDARSRRLGKLKLLRAIEVLEPLVAEAEPGDIVIEQLDLARKALAGLDAD